MGLATVYRTLTLLERVGLVRKLEVGDGIARYELNEKDESPHCHLVCAKCNRVIEKSCPCTKKIRNFFEIDDFSITDHSLVLFGLCSECQNDEN